MLFRSGHDAPLLQQRRVRLRLLEPRPGRGRRLAVGVEPELLRHGGPRDRAAPLQPRVLRVEAPGPLHLFNFTVKVELGLIGM